MHLTFLTRCIKHLTSQEVRRAGEAFAGCILEESNCCCILKKVTAVVGNSTFYKGNDSVSL